MKTSAAGKKLISEFEGLRLDAYICPSGIPTIGVGHTGPDVVMGMKITEDRAMHLLEQDLTRFEKAVDSLITAKLSQPQFDALVSFAFNCGAGALEESTLRKRLNKGEDPNTVAKEELPKWCKGPNGPLPGLVRRRNAEVNLFCSGEKFTAAKTISLTATHDTLFKKEPAAGAELEASQKAQVVKGKKYNDVEVMKEYGGHTQVVLPYNLGTWWVFNGHWAELDGQEDKPEPAGDGSIRLDVPYFNQLDNYAQAHRTCNSSSCAMCLAYLRPGKINGDDDYLKKLINGGYGDTTDHGAQGRLLQSYGLNSTWHTNLGFSNLETELRLGRPVVIGILHRGPLSAPIGGHMCVVIGMTAKGDFIVNDPYGSCNDGYSGPVTNGKGAIYTRAMLKARWLPEGENSGWGRTFQP